MQIHWQILLQHNFSFYLKKVTTKADVILDQKVGFQVSAADFRGKAWNVCVSVTKVVYIFTEVQYLHSCVMSTDNITG